MFRKKDVETRRTTDLDIASLNSQIHEVNSTVSGGGWIKRGLNNLTNLLLRKELVLAIMFVIVVAGLFFMQGGITAWMIAGDEYISYTQELDFNATHSGDEQIILEDYSKQFNLKSLRLSGYIKGEGTVSVYLVGNGGRRYLALDRDTVRIQGLGAITGHAINIPDGITLAENSDERTITTVLEYNPGTLWDPDDDGIAYVEDGVVDLTVADTEFNWQADESKLCTKWVVANDEGTETTICNGVADCCMLAGVAPEEEEWTTPLYVFHGKYGATETNTVIAQVIFLNQSIGNETYLESTIGVSAYTTVRFEDKPIIRFKNICKDTCTLPDGLNETGYTLEFELEPGMELYLDNMTYAVENMSITLPEEEIGANETNKTQDVIGTADLVPAVKDSKGNTLGTTVDFLDPDDGVIHAQRNIKAEKADIRSLNRNSRGFLQGSTKSLAASENKKVNVNQGKYTVRINFTNKSESVKSIEIEEFNVHEDNTEFIKVDYVDSIDELTRFEKVYAIDPTSVNFTNATVTVVATGEKLYKCFEWNFNDQNCEGEWKFLQNIVAGEEYTFTITPDDPGLAESGGTFFEGWETNSLSTNNWTQSGAGDDCQIVDFSTYSGSYSLQCMPKGAENSIETSIDTTGYTDVNFTFYTQTSGLDSGEYISADWYDGSTWHNVLPQTEDIGSYTLYNYGLNSSADNNVGLKIRFNCNAGSNNERCFVDNVQVSGTQAQNDSTPPSQVDSIEGEESGTWVYWTWTNPSDSDFDHTELWVNGVWQANVSTNNYNSTGLDSWTSYTVLICTV